MSQVLLVQGNALQIPLADQSVHMVVTSPPYFGLRDYGTATWEGGEDGCDHRKRPLGLPKSATSPLRGRATNQNSEREPGYRDSCGKCGAIRHDNQLGLEPLHDCGGAFTGHTCHACWVCSMRQVFRECWRVLRDDGVMFVNIGDSYNANTGVGFLSNKRLPKANRDTVIKLPGAKPKSLLGMPWRLALALQQDEWILRSDIIWEKPSCMPESAQDRPTRSHEYVFLFAKQARYFWDAEAIRESASYGRSDQGNNLYARARQADPRDSRETPPVTNHYGDPSSGRNARTIWCIPSEPFSGAHFAAFPSALAEKAIRAGTSQHGVCAKCGAPWRRVVTRQRLLDGHIPVTGAFSRPDEPFRIPANGKGHWRYTTQTTEHGWQPSCACHAPVTPAIVFDPFVGTGTTLLAARALGRHGIGTDLSWPYLRDIARERLGLAALARWEGSSTAPPAPLYADLPLFA